MDDLLSMATDFKPDSLDDVKDAKDKSTQNGGEGFGGIDITGLGDMGLDSIGAGGIKLPDLGDVGESDTEKQLSSNADQNGVNIPNTGGVDLPDVGNLGKNISGLGDLSENIPGLGDLGGVPNVGDVGDALESLTGMLPADLLSKIPGADFLGFGDDDEDGADSSNDGEYDVESLFSDLGSFGADIAEFFTDSKQFFTQVGALVALFSALINTGNNVASDYKNGNITTAVFNTLLLVAIQIPTLTAMLVVFLKDKVRMTIQGFLKAKEELEELYDDLESLMDSDDDEDNDSNISDSSENAKSNGDECDGEQKQKDKKTMEQSEEDDLNSSMSGMKMLPEGSCDVGDIEMEVINTTCWKGDENGKSNELAPKKAEKDGKKSGADKSKSKSADKSNSDDKSKSAHMKSQGHKEKGRSEDKMLAKEHTKQRHQTIAGSKAHKTTVNSPQKKPHPGGSKQTAQKNAQNRLQGQKHSSQGHAKGTQGQTKHDGGNKKNQHGGTSGHQGQKNIKPSSHQGTRRAAQAHARSKENHPTHKPKTSSSTGNRKHAIDEKSAKSQRHKNNPDKEVFVDINSELTKEKSQRPRTSTPTMDNEIKELSSNVSPVQTNDNVIINMD